ncbi:L-threonylcarbamoyladenylate synthase [Mycoplasma sp. ATU-Cv-508]|uniref:Sua5/YciO/YrdC/YwlC family protein n=1 Tax=Mycoplasma sp. ATU-Cv-508 TaxID=2048001 RepID=UPI001374D1A0
MLDHSSLFLASTDTVVGLGGPISQANHQLICQLKKRSPEKPLVVMVGSYQQARQFPEWSVQAEKFARKIWPGPYTLVLSDNLALRMPAHLQLLNLIKKIGPVYMTSANLAGQPPLNFEQARAAFPSVRKHYYFGKGSGRPSTVIRLSDKKVLRE